jgi:hypothetical protein
MFQLQITKQYLESIVKGSPILSDGCEKINAKSIKVFETYRTDYDDEYEDKEDDPTLHWYVNCTDLDYYVAHKSMIDLHFQTAVSIVWNNIRRLVD